MGDRIDFDDDDWWFRATMPRLSDGPGVIEFDGLATIAEVWFNRELVLKSDNMFVAHRCEVELQTENVLVVVCRSMKQHLAIRRRRPQWKTRLVSNQQLRWIRTTLLGRMPGWSPGPAPVGPWRPVRAVSFDTTRVTDFRAASEIAGGGDGVVDISCEVNGGPGADRVARSSEGSRPNWITMAPSGRWIGRAVVPAPRRWFPHTHGEPALYQVSVGVLASGEEMTFDQQPIGFRTVDVARWNAQVQLVINGVEVFARGTCWVPPDVVAMWSDDASLRRALEQVVDCGMNLLRVPGTTVFEQPRFHELCDELGIMVWQDFMFANMQYPISDEGFVVSIIAEATEQSIRLCRHPSTVVLCGGSEVEQQAAMMGAAEDVTAGHQLGSVLLRDIVRSVDRDIAYVVDSPSGGPLPFSLSSGVSHYFGVGAYLRPLEDARTAGVRFASECLAFANVPDQGCVDSFMKGVRAPQAPEWKIGVPRDGGAGWDFDDVRDHYCQVLFGIVPSDVRYADPERYLDLGRATSAFVVEQTVAEWRRSRNPCSGAIVLQLRDVRAGAGWGLIDVFGHPKAAFYGMRRAARPVALLMSDDGLDGLKLAVHNDLDRSFVGSVEISVIGRDTVEVASTSVDVPAGHSCELDAAELLAGFSDLTYAYRFGPLRHEVVVAKLLDDAGSAVSAAHYFPGGFARPMVSDDVLSASARLVPGGIEVEVSARSLAQFVSLDFGDHYPDDNWFHLEPGAQRVVTCRPLASASNRSVSGEIRAINVVSSVFVHVQPAAAT